MPLQPSNFQTKLPKVTGMKFAYGSFSIYAFQRAERIVQMHSFDSAFIVRMQQNRLQGIYETHFFIRIIKKFQISLLIVIVLVSVLEVIKRFSCSKKLSTKFQLIIKTKIQTNKEVSCFKSLRCCFYHANKC